jgi:hypothetical protein
MTRSDELLQPAKRLSKALPYPIFLRLYLASKWLRDVRELHWTRRNIDVQLLKTVDINKLKTSDTLFILGSGSSINQISADRWKAIARNDTIGCNFWLYHPFVPHMYFFEAIPRSYKLRYDEFNKIARHRADDYRDTLKVVTELLEPVIPGDFRLRHGDDFACPDQWKTNLYTLITFAVPAQNEREFATALRYVNSKGIFSVCNRLHYIFKQSSTVSSLVALGIRMRYRRIILCGVDLKNSEYFYQDPDLYPETSRVRFQPQDQVHFGLTPMPWMITTDTVLLELKKQVLDPLGIEIYVENRSSALWPVIPAAPEELFDSRQMASGAD